MRSSMDAGMTFTTVWKSADELRGRSGFRAKTCRCRSRSAQVHEELRTDGASPGYCSKRKRDYGGDHSQEEMIDLSFCSRLAGIGFAE